MTLQTFAATDDIQEMVVALQQTGAVVIDSCYRRPDGLCADLRPEFDREGHLYQNTFNGHHTSVGVTKYSAHFPNLLHPTVLTIADAILKPHCEVYRLAVRQRSKFAGRGRSGSSCRRYLLPQSLAAF